MTESRKKKEKLSGGKIRILYYLRKHKDFRGSKVSLSKDLGYKGDSRTNINLNELIRDGYLTEEATPEGSSYKLTQKGVNQIQFFLIPDALLVMIAVLGALDTYTGLLALFNISSLSVITPVAVGIVLLIFVPVFWVIKNRTIEQFFRIERDSLPD
jgi:hypothetical protein